MEYATTEQLFEWAAELNSGKYQQGKHQLKKEDSYCCLGVAKEVCKLEEVDWYSDTGPTIFLEFLSDDGETKSIFLPPNVQMFLASLNDKGFNFVHIAQVITKFASRLYPDPDERNVEIWKDIDEECRKAHKLF